MTAQATPNVAPCRTQKGDGSFEIFGCYESEVLSLELSSNSGSLKFIAVSCSKLISVELPQCF